MYEFAYSAICEELPPPAPVSRRHNIPEALELIEAVDRACASSHEQQQLLSDFRQLWLAIANSILNAGPGLPAGTQANMLSAARDILEEIERRRFKKACMSPLCASAAAPERLL